VDVEESMFFSEEKNQKTFMSALYPALWPWPDLSAGTRVKVFWFFSSEKNMLAFKVLSRG
jgi:hypothetical protein